MPYTPNVKGLVPPQVAEAIRTLSLRLDKVEGELVMARQQLATQQSPSLQLLRAGLQVGGNAPLNVTQLLGQLAQPQLAYVPAVTTLPAGGDPQAQEGSLVAYTGNIYRYTSGAWVAATGGGTVTSIGLTQTNTALGAAFTITSSPVTGAGNINVAITNVLALCTATVDVAGAPNANTGKIAVRLNGVVVNVMVCA